MRLMNGSSQSYFLVGTNNPAEITSLIKQSIDEGKKLHLPYSIFDPEYVDWQNALAILRNTSLNSAHLQLILKTTPKREYIKAVGDRVTVNTAHIYARCLPTLGKPPLVSRYQFFKYLIISQ